MKRDLDLIAFTWFEIWNDVEMKRPTQKDIKDILDRFNKGERVKRSNYNNKFKIDDVNQVWFPDNFKTKKNNARIIKQYL